MFKKSLTALAVCLATAIPAPAADPDILIADFEWETWEGSDWTVAGEAFGPGPARGTLPRQMQVSGFKGDRLLNSFHGGDEPTGTLTSPRFTIEHDYINFLIGGGGHEGKTCMNLLVDGKVVRTATGPNTQPGGSETLDWHAWDVADLAGKEAVLQVVDDYSGGWGHLNVDHILQSDRKRAAETTRRERAFTVDSKYLVMPIENKGRGGTTIHLYVGDQKVRQYQLHPARSAEQADWYAFFTIERYQGKEARVVVDAVTEDGFALIRQSDMIPGEENFYQEPHRPQFHFTQKVGWNNDPNGMVWHDGTWHLFFQHNPVGLPWGNMTWGHATSPDLLHWQQQPKKLFPKTMAVRDCFSGGATVDKHNTAGWGENTLVAFFTDTGAGEAIAYSTDGGETFTYYEGNPVVKHRGRDPKVIWYDYREGDAPIDERAAQLGGHWVMVVYNEDAPHGRSTAFHTSTNLREWTFRSRLIGYYECPELYELPVDGDESNTRWVTYGADARYVLGSFDGTVFTPDHEEKYQVHWGAYYAAQTFDNSPDGRRIQIGWARVTAPGPYNQHFTFPHVMTLRNTGDGIRLFAEPIGEIEKLRVRSRRGETKELADGQPQVLPVDTDLLDVRLNVQVGDAKRIVLELPGRSVTYDVEAAKLNDAPLAPVDGTISIQVLADRLLTEIIGNDGRVYITAGGLPEPEGGQVSVTAHGGDARLISLETHELRSIWHGDVEDGLSENIHRAVQALEAAAPEVAQDPTRPGFHLLPPARWMNDVCGAFYYHGWHHVFYQHTPYADRWGTDNGVGWGHARSKDLIHWEHLPPALMPADGRDNRMDASGSAFFDGQGRPVLFFAKTPRSGPREQWAAVPVDDQLIRWRRVDIGLAPGRSGVPAGISRGWADMFVFEANGRVFAVFKASDGLLVEAQNEELTRWRAVGRIQGVAGECPNLFPLEDRYVLIRSTYPISYVVGQFCAADFAFHPGENPLRTLDYGYGSTRPGPWHRGLYGTTAFHDARGRTVLMGWASGFQDGRGWNGCASLPRVLTLTDDDQLIQTPLPELAGLRDRQAAWQGTLDNEAKVLAGISGDMLEIRARFRAGSAATVGLKLRPEGREEDAIAVRLAGSELDVAGTPVPDALSADGTLKLHLFFDRSVLEVFIDGGRKSVTKVVYPPEGQDLVVEAFAEDGAADVPSLAAWTLRSIGDGQSSKNSPKEQRGQASLFWPNPLVNHRSGYYAGEITMPRPPRADEAGGLYHALNRGNLRAEMFHKDEDFSAFERILHEGLQLHQVQLFSYQLMPNHYHFRRKGRTSCLSCPTTTQSTR